MATQQLAQIADFATFGGPVAAFTTASPTQQNAYLIAGSADLIDAISERYTPPYASWGTNVTEKVCAIAGYLAMCARGYDAGNPQDVSVKQRRDSILEKGGWCERVNEGQITLNDLVDSTAGQIDDNAIGGDGSDTGRFGDPSIDQTAVP